MVKGVKGFQKGHKHSLETKIKIGNANRNQIYFNCEYCGKESSDRPSHYARKKRHFCSIDCYSKFRIELLPFNEQHAYKGIRKEGESKQVYHRNYCKNNPENMAHLKARRYARERNAKGTHSLQQWKELKIKHNNKCAICGLEKSLTKDHIIPLSKGGSDYIENIQPLCRNCNSKKYNKIPNY
jgi:5-methylcytosine-specific restriction endonuclease McrA